MRAAGEKNASFEPFIKGGKAYFEDSFLATLACNLCILLPMLVLSYLLSSLPYLVCRYLLLLHWLCAHFEQSFS